MKLSVQAGQGKSAHYPIKWIMYRASRMVLPKSPNRKKGILWGFILRYTNPILIGICVFVLLLSVLRMGTVDPVVASTMNSISNDQLVTTNIKCQKDSTKTNQRWSDRVVSSSNVQSMFNCDLPDSDCEYYFPANFFDKTCGLGKSYAHHTEDMEDMRKNNTLWLNMPSVGFPTLTMNNLCFKGTMQEPRDSQNGLVKDAIVLNDIGEHAKGEMRCLTERLSMIHVHKAGGTSLHTSFNTLSRSKNSVLVRHKWFTPLKSSNVRPRTTNPGISSAKEKMIDFTVESLTHATKYPAMSFGKNDHVIFAVVRDPVERFISSIGQAMGGAGSTGNQIGRTLQKKCIKSTSAETLKCMAKYVQKHGFWIELHFTPQVLDISFTTVFQDVPIAVFPFQKLKSILAYFGTPDVRGRNGSNPSYRPDSALTSMTVADYDDESLRIVCEIYEMDIIMQRSLGIDTSKCDPFIPMRN